MPVYEYNCLECGKHFDALRKMDEMDKTIACPHCGSDETKKQFSVFGVVGGQKSSSNSRKTPPSCGGG